VRVAAILANDGKVLLVEHRRGRHRYFLLPGGGVGFGETMEEALAREVAEECGISIHVGRPVILSDSIDPSGARHVINVVFEASDSGREVPKGTAARELRIAGCVWMPVDELGRRALHPPIAEAIGAVLSEEGRAEARCLGPRWTDRYEDV
jgi:8-oxo-dGTP diphosphatase